MHICFENIYRYSIVFCENNKHTPNYDFIEITTQDFQQNPGCFRNTCIVSTQFALSKLCLYVTAFDLSETDKACVQNKHCGYVSKSYQHTVSVSAQINNTQILLLDLREDKQSLLLSMC